ncbi:hypothetical protein NQZ68_037952 [Dissostichus eleginoides]|nr:hypothetical protein NQZ68_037952 [Dissostichus eleginoides]
MSRLQCCSQPLGSHSSDLWPSPGMSMCLAEAQAEAQESTQIDVPHPVLSHLLTIRHTTDRGANLGSDSGDRGQGRLSGWFRGRK